MTTNFEMFNQSSTSESILSEVHDSLRADADGPLVRCQSSSPGCLPIVEFDSEKPQDDQPKKSNSDERPKTSPDSGENLKIGPWMQLLRSPDTEKPLVARLPKRVEDIGDLSTRDLEVLAHDRATSDNAVNERMKAFQELIRRYDEKLPTKEFEKALGKLSKLQGDGTQARTMDSFEEFGEITGRMQDHIRIRQEYAEFLKRCGKFDEAQKAALDAEEKAQILLKPVRIDNKTVTPWNLIRRESLETLIYMGRFGSKEAQQLEKLLIDKYIGRDGILNRPRQTSILVSEISLGTKINWNKENPEADLGKSKSFDLKGAYEAAKRARETTIQLFRYDPLDRYQNDRSKGEPSVKALFDLMLDAIENSERTKQPLLGPDGKPVSTELIERIKKELSF
ncbi:MAG: hypothetical protein K2Z81_15255 [Cyanobacteria bacterium]|nr:hypothetical protein [Cyanobacteriota bacterium]